jgi:AraC-like DNA-binding protein
MATAPTEPVENTDLARALRQHLAGSLSALAKGQLQWRQAPAGNLSQRGEGHFHLAPELFVQLQGHTDFSFPQGRQLRLLPGQAVVLPPQLLHAEQVAPGPQGQPFCNLVLQAEGQRLACHLAHEHQPGVPGIAHLEVHHHRLAGRVHDWLHDACRSDELPEADMALQSTQQHALLAAALAASLRLLEAPAPAPADTEPALVARLRVMVQNQLGDQTLSVSGLAQQSGCTADHLSHVFARCTGEHLVAHINRLRLARAQRLLRETGMAIKEVAWACGYASPGYFIRSFRQQLGCTPRAWRATC